MSNSSEQTADSEEINPIALCVIGLILLTFLVESVGYFFDARLQHRAASFPFVIGQMTGYEWIDSGFSPCGPPVKRDGLNVEYTYSVDGDRYFGTRKRFAWRQFGSGSPAAIALAKSWGKGNHVKVFYDPKNPSHAALDNLFTPGDWKTLAAAVILFLASTLTMALFVIRSYLAYFEPSESVDCEVRNPTDYAESVHV